MPLLALEKHQRLALAAAAGLAAAAYVRRRLKTKIRAAFDIGSGEHKLVVAAVHGTTVRVLHSEVSTVLLAQDLTRPGGDGALKVFGRPGVEEPLGRGTYKDPSRSRSRSRRWLRVP